MPVNLGMTQFFLEDNLVSLSIVNRLERKKKLSRKLILMIYTLLLCLRTIQHSGNVGGLNLSFRTNAVRLTAVLIQELLQINLFSISCSNIHKAEVLKQSYLTLRATCCRLPITESYKFDTELVSKIITELKRGKALDIDGLSAEHLQFSHPVLSAIKNCLI